MIYYHGINNLLIKITIWNQARAAIQYYMKLEVFLGFPDKNIQKRLRQISDIWDLKDQPDTSHTS